MATDARSLNDDVREYACRQGGDLYGVAPVERYHEYHAELKERMAATRSTHVDFMIRPADRNHFERITDPRNTLPAARAVIVIGAYAYDTNAAEPREQKPWRGKIARTYTYFPVARRAGDAVAAFLRGRGYQAVAGQDVPLKYAASRIGLGCYGRNGILLTEKFGSYVALRSVITDAPLATTHAECTPPCTNCDRCLKACPTGALYAAGKVNPRLCINPMTRRDDPIAPEARVRMGNRLRGCDICQEVCPVNRRLTPRPPDPRARYEPEYHETHRGLGGLTPFPELLGLLGPDRPDLVRRQAAIALANTARGDREVVAALRSQLDSCSDHLRPYFLWAIDVCTPPVR